VAVSDWPGHKGNYDPSLAQWSTTESQSHLHQICAATIVKPINDHGSISIRKKFGTAPMFARDMWRTSQVDVDDV